MELFDCPTDDLVENDWNPNDMTKLRFDALIESMHKHPELIQADRLVVRAKGAKFEILGGAHRFRAAKINGFEKIPVGNLGTIDDAKAKLISLILNNHGEEDFDKKLSIIHSIKSQVSLNKIANEIGENYSSLNILLTDMELKTDGLQGVITGIESDPPHTTDTVLADILGGPRKERIDLPDASDRATVEKNTNINQMDVPDDVILHVSGPVRDAVLLGGSLGHTSIESTIDIACTQFVNAHHQKGEISI